MHLIVRVPFGDFNIGERISDPALIAAILEGDRTHHASHVVKVPDEAHGWTERPPEQPAPIAEPAPEPKPVVVDAVEEPSHVE